MSHKPTISIIFLLIAWFFTIPMGLSQPFEDIEKTLFQKLAIANTPQDSADIYANIAYNYRRRSPKNILTYTNFSTRLSAVNSYTKGLGSTIDFKQKNTEVDTITKEMEVKNQNEVKIREIEELERAARQDNQQIRYLTGFLLLIGLLLLILVKLYHKKNDIAYKLDQKNQEIVAQSEELQQLNELKNKLFSTISHDLKSPIADLENSLSLLTSGELTPNEFMSFAEELKGDTVQLRQTLEELMNWSYMQMIGLHPRPHTIQLKESVSSAVQFCGKQAKTKNITLINEISPNEYVYADQEHLSSILRNLIFNGIKFSHPNQTIVVGSSRKEDQVAFYVKDEGIGIPKENLQSVFDIGVTSWGTAGEKGTGLGLALCKEFVEKNGGEIRVESLLSKGSTFWVTLPATTNQLSEDT